MFRRYFQSNATSAVGRESSPSFGNGQRMREIYSPPYVRNRERLLMQESRPSGLGMTFLACGSILAALILVMLFVPMVTCPRCDMARSWERGMENLSRDVELPMSSFPSRGCKECFRGRMSLLNWWTRYHNAPTR